jgi:hypothetical protein
VNKTGVYEWGSVLHKIYTQNTALIHSKYFQERPDFTIKFELSTEIGGLITITTLIYKQDIKNNAIS